MSLATAISLKLVSVLLFAVMAVLVRSLGEAVPLGEVVFFRSAFAIIPVVVIYALRRELAAAVRTQRPFGHVARGLISVASMFLNFAALARLPLVDASAISFAAPLITVVLAALMLKERVRAHLWFAVAIGFVGVIVMLWPYLSLSKLVMAGSTAGAVGALCALMSAFTNAGSVIQTRRLTASETTSSIVLYFSLVCTAAGAATLPFVWQAPTPAEFAALASIGVLGGISHLLLTESYRHAPASTAAPFDYVYLLWVFLFGYVFFDEIPSLYVYVGAAIVAASGLYVILRDRRLRRKQPARSGSSAAD
jgi:drug/metabolite transporter (DMT)-like permease